MASESRQTKAERTSAPNRHAGFGVDADRAAYHFVVHPNADRTVSILERFPETASTADGEGASPDAEKVRISAYRWDRVSDVVGQEFNARLLAEGKRPGRWLKGDTVLTSYFGKELTLLGWAIEDADATIIPMMVANWRGLAPEERWWFYTTINASSNGPDYGKDRGWRKAIKIAFAGNPVDLPPSALLVGPQEIPGTAKRTRRRVATKPGAEQGSLGLFDDP